MNRSIKMVQKGFTLIELMIVVAIIGILAALAIPAYQDYVARSQASEALTITDGLKIAIQEFYAERGTCPDNTAASATLDAYNIDQPATAINGTYVASVLTGASGASTSVCIMTAQFKGAGDVSKKLVAGTIIIEGNMDAGSEVPWNCDQGTIPTTNPEVTPSACKP